MDMVYHVQFFADRETAKDLGGWECNMEKKSDGGGRKRRTDEGRNEHEMIVIDCIELLEGRN